MMKELKNWLIIAVAALVLNACSPAGGESTGSEYMPDMAHHIAYEANVYSNYYYNSWDDQSIIKRKALSNINEPVAGTIPRGYAGVYFSSDVAAQDEMMHHLHGQTKLNEIAVPLNGSVPYYYTDTEEERLRATAEIIDNPFPITKEGLSRGLELYAINCAICHGSKGDGLGYIVNDAENKNVKYPAQPANFLMDDFLAASNGRYYHAIMYGKNVMGGYADKLSYEERWQVIHYIRVLQAKEKKLDYSEEVNTLNPTFGTPLSQFNAIAQSVTDTATQPGTGEEGEAGHETTDGQPEGGHSTDLQNQEDQGSSGH
ncbi:MAG: hypothetical protein DHS20C18_21920 [Saprospiraceae bacterium]|nr:MAG: hypothetical protein DHS20C18_21920 [Saprospiraceae bacterium]